MTLFLDFRSSGTGGTTQAEPRVYDATMDGAGVGTYRPATILAGRIVASDGGALNLGIEGAAPDPTALNILFATHGFNVDRPKGVRSLIRLQRDLRLGPGWLFVGVLWPGDWKYPIPLNYPAEGRDADASGRALARFANRYFPNAVSVSMLSHSMGARVVLTAATDMAAQPAQVCVTAPAVDNRTLGVAQRYDAARGRSGRITVLSSRGDRVLAAAYPAGTAAALATQLDDMPLGWALGFTGSSPQSLARVANLPIPGNLINGYDHGDYYPSSKPVEEPNPKADQSIRAMSQALHGAARLNWPPP